MDTLKKTGARFSAIRRRAGLTQWDAARKAGITNETLSRIERGYQWVGFDVLSKLAKAYGVDVAEMFSDAPGGASGAKQAALQEIMDTLSGRTMAEVEKAAKLLQVALDMKPAPKRVRKS